MRGEIGKPRAPRAKKPANEKKKGNRFRREEENRKKRTFSCARLYDVDERSLPADIEEQRKTILAKADRLAFPTETVGKYKKAFLRKLYARDVSAGGPFRLRGLHKSVLDFLLNDLLHQNSWIQVSGILSVLLRSLLNERTWKQEYSEYIWAAMEVTRQLEGFQGNDLKFRKMYQILHEKQPKGPWSRNKAESGAVLLELALYLMSQKQFEDANLASEPFMDVPPYRDHPLANLLHGLVHYYRCFELIKQDLSQELDKIVGGDDELEVVDFSEGVGENDGIFNDLHSSRMAECVSDNNIFNLDDGFHSESTSTCDIMNKKNKASKSFKNLGDPGSQAKEETMWNIDDDAEDDVEKSYLKKTRILYSRNLDKKLFPFRLSRQCLGKDYMLPMETAAQRNSYNTAMKHLKDALSLDKDSTAALLPLVQLMLAGGDIEGAYSEIDKCCKKFDDCASLSVKCLFLESLTPKNKVMLYNAYKNVLEKDPSSAQIMERLMDMHKAGDCDTGVLLQHLGHHLDACAGSIDVWRKLSACFLKLKECDSNHSKENMDSSNDGFVHTCDFDFLQCESAREEWKLRERWWAGKHFYHGDIEVELNSRGMLWLLFKAAGAAHIYGPDTLYVSEAERVLQVIGSQSGLERLQMHKRNYFNLLSRVRLSTYLESTI